MSACLLELGKYEFTIQLNRAARWIKGISRARSYKSQSQKEPKLETERIHHNETYCALLADRIVGPETPRVQEWPVGPWSMG